MGAPCTRGARQIRVEPPCAHVAATMALRARRRGLPSAPQAVGGQCRHAPPTVATPPLSPFCVRSSTARSQGAGGGPARGQTPLLTAVPPAGGPLCDDFLCRRFSAAPPPVLIGVRALTLLSSNWVSPRGPASAVLFPPPAPFPHPATTPRRLLTTEGLVGGVRGRPVWAGWLPLREACCACPPPLPDRRAGGTGREVGIG